MKMLYHIFLTELLERNLTREFNITGIILISPNNEKTIYTF